MIIDNFFAEDNITKGLTMAETNAGGSTYTNRPLGK